MINPWLRTGPCSPAACVRAAASAAGTPRLAVRLVAAACVVLAGLPLALATCHARADLRAATTRAWARLLLHALGLRLEVTTADAHPGEPLAGAGRGKPSGRPTAAGVLVVANHISWLDPLVIAAVVPSRPLAKREIARWPVVRTLAAGSGALFIDRERLSALPDAVATVAGALRAGDTVVAFPEGTTWCGRGMGTFRPAVFQAAIDAGAAVRPATLRYQEGGHTSTRACYVGDDSLLASVLRVAATRHLVVEVRLSTPVRPADQARRPQGRAAPARTELARTAEAQVRTGVAGRHG